MGDKGIDNALKTYFSSHSPPPAEVKAKLRAKLYAAESAQHQLSGPIIWVWGIVVYDIAICSAIMFLLWMLIGPSTFVYIITAYAVFSMFAIMAIAIAAQIALKPQTVGKKANLWHYS